MKKTTGDIEGLMRSFGGKADGFKEIAREEDANQALKRWPLLSSMETPAEAPPALTGEQKQGWLVTSDAGADAAATSQPAERFESDRLASGLDRLVSRCVAPALADAAAVEVPAEKPVRMAQRVEQPKKGGGPAKVLRSSAAGGQSQSSFTPMAKRFLGLGGERKNTSSRDLTSKRQVADDSLASIFSRVDKAHKPKSSAFGRLFGKDKYKK